MIETAQKETTLRRARDARPAPRSEVLGAAGLIALCAVMAWLDWNKLNSLLDGDPAWWMHESLRFARGELPYRDFFWQYPPLGLMAIGYPLRWFGASFTVVQLVVDLLSAAMVAAAYVVARFLFSPSVAFAATGLLVVVCATTRTYFSLFSLWMYSPSLLVAALGLMLLMAGACLYLRSGILRPFYYVLMCAGSFVAIAGKQEAMLGATALLGALALGDRTVYFAGRPFSSWARTYILVFFGCLAPVAVFFLAFAQSVGGEVFRDAMGGYGLATFACPWWPTGLGVFGACSAAAVAIFAAALVSLPKRRELMARIGRRGYAAMWALAVVGLPVYISYERYLHWPASSTAPLLAKWRTALDSILGTSGFLRPVMWASIAYWAYLAWSLHKRRESPTARRQALLLLVFFSPGVFMCSRSLFGWTLYPYPEVPAICYPFFIICMPWLILRLLDPAPVAGAKATRYATAVACGIAALYGVVRITGAYPSMLSGHQYTTLQTSAGAIRLRDYAINKAAYEFIMAHTLPADFIIEGPYGGGMMFATRRKSPTYSTLFKQVPTPRRYLALDLKRVQEHPPKVAVFDSARHFGIHWGVEGTMRCSCPRLVWVPDVPSWDPNDVVPIVPFLQTHYRVAKTIGGKVILTLADAPPA